MVDKPERNRLVRWWSQRLTCRVRYLLWPGSDRRPDSADRERSHRFDFHDESDFPRWAAAGFPDRYKRHHELLCQQSKYSCLSAARLFAGLQNSRESLSIQCFLAAAVALSTDAYNRLCGRSGTQPFPAQRGQSYSSGAVNNSGRHGVAYGCWCRQSNQRRWSGNRSEPADS